MLCPHDKCQWYSDKSKYGTACYYEPQCWRGLMDGTLVILKKIAIDTIRPPIFWVMTTLLFGCSILFVLSLIELLG